MALALFEPWRNKLHYYVGNNGTLGTPAIHRRCDRWCVVIAARVLINELRSLESPDSATLQFTITFSTETFSKTSPSLSNHSTLLLCLKHLCYSFYHSAWSRRKISIMSIVRARPSFSKRQVLQNRSNFDSSLTGCAKSAGSIGKKKKRTSIKRPTSETVSVKTPPAGTQRTPLLEKNSK